MDESYKEADPIVVKQRHDSERQQQPQRHDGTTNTTNTTNNDDDEQRHDKRADPKNVVTNSRECSPNCDFGSRKLSKMNDPAASPHITNDTNNNTNNNNFGSKQVRMRRSRS